jgi:predicted RND superfamily exporter protein
VDDVTAIAPAATGAPLTIVRSAGAIVGAFRQAFAYALVAIAVVLALLLRRARDVVAVLATLCLCGLLTGASAVALGLDFDFANVIALPLLLGIGVDAAVHVLHRARAGRALGEAPGDLLRTSTARGIVFSAATTFASFANLATSSHPGTAGMGLLLTLGFAWTLAVALVALPACLPAARESAPLS